MPPRGNMGGALGYDLKSEKQEIAEITSEIKKELILKWKKSYANAQIFPPAVAAMHPEVVDFLLSVNLTGVYDNIARQVNLDSNGRNVLPRIVWQLAQSKKWESLDELLQAQLPIASSMRAALAGQLQQNILNKARALGEKVVEKKVISQKPQIKEIQLAISDALEKYPKINEQGITENQIKLQNSPEPARPSVRNWVKDFQDNLGSMKHSPIDRGNFLFHSENGKSLNAADRQKLAIVLKSLDEQTMLMIDPIAQQIVFDSGADTAEIDEKKQIVTATSDLNQNPERGTDSRFLADDKTDSLKSLQTRNDFGKVQQPVSQSLPPQQRAASSSIVDLKNNSFSSDILPKENIEIKKIILPAPIKQDLPLNSPRFDQPNNTNVFQTAPNPVARPSVFVEVPTPIRKIESETYFSIPGSKPPIGTDEYHGKDAVSLQAEKDESNFQSLHSAQISSRAKVPASTSTIVSENIAIAAPIAEQKNESFHSSIPQNRDSLSDEELIRIYQEKKSREKSATPTPAQNASPIAAFSPRKNLWHIVPEESSSDREVNKKNIVDLKN